MTRKTILGVDTGGTFTDFVLLQEGRLQIHKVLSTPQSPEQAILQGIRDLGVSLDDLIIVHGSTVATNAVLEGKGVTVAYITNRGLGDVLSIGRQARSSLFDLQPPYIEPPVPKEYCLETGGRLAADGSMLEPLEELDLIELHVQVHGLGVRAVAINLLYSWLDDESERRIEDAMPANVFISRSSEVLPEYREYERGISTWLNASVGPLVEGYLQRLVAAVNPARVAVMQSSGGTIEASLAGKQAVRMLLSGPAGGLAGAQYMARLVGCEQLLTFDMGGTSTDVALIDGEIQLTNEALMAGYPVAVPMVDMHTIGAGGGSLARVDTAGLLHVGPESGGADPGPACYGRGGTQATVTDANLVLGRLRPDAFLGGSMQLDVEAAQKAVDDIAGQLGCSRGEAADGIIRLANEHMARALRVISVERGVDPREFMLVCFGGAGGLHVCALAEALGIKKAMVPIHGGVLSAFGMLVTPPSRALSRTCTARLNELDTAQLESQFHELMEEGLLSLAEEGVERGRVEIAWSVDLRYLGQSYTLNVKLQENRLDSRGCARAFHELHMKRYGHALDEVVELVNIRVSLRAIYEDETTDPMMSKSSAFAGDEVVLQGGSAEVYYCPREIIKQNHIVVGPALVSETVATTWIAPAWRARVHPTGNLLLERESEEA